MKHIPQMREIRHLNPQRLGSLYQLTIASLDRAREMAVNGSEGYTYLHSHSQALLAENLELSRQLQTLKSLTKSSVMEGRDSSRNDQSHSSYTLKFLP